METTITTIIILAIEKRDILMASLEWTVTHVNSVGSYQMHTSSQHRIALDKLGSTFRGDAKSGGALLFIPKEHRPST
jgi:hypothetical protein